MKLTGQELFSIATGAVRYTEEKMGVQLLRFTEEQEKHYKTHKARDGRDVFFYNQSFAPAGIRLRFLTDATSLSLEIFTQEASSRKFFCFDVFVDGNLVATIKNFPEEIFNEKHYADNCYSLGKLNQSIDLGVGEKTVEIYCPWSVKVWFQEFILENATYITPVKRDKTLLVFGDSIRQGYDALHPSNRYLSKLSNYFKADEYNKAIGGERYVFISELADMKDEFLPEYVFISYGSNDWFNEPSLEKIKNAISVFLGKIKKRFSYATIFLETPLWRDGLGLVSECKFEQILRFIEETGKELNMVILNGYDCIPKNETYMADKYTHPNDFGFEFYSKNIIKQIERITL